MDFLSEFFGKRPRKRLKIAGPGTYELDVVDASNYQKPLRKITGGPAEEGRELGVIATLVHENDNTRDTLAVRVDIDGRTVGYLDRKSARSYRRQLERAGHGGKKASCDAKIVGERRRGLLAKEKFRVRLDLLVTEHVD